MVNRNLSAAILAICCVTGAGAGSVAAQGATPSAMDTRGLTIGAAAGGTYYCIVSRCGTGATLGMSAALNLTPVLAVTAGAGRHFCFDCDRFLIADAALQLRAPGRTFEPFLSGGISLVSDPELMGRKTGVFGATGMTAWFAPKWGARLQVSGRTAGRGDAVGEISLGGQRKFR